METMAQLGAVARAIGSVAPERAQRPMGPQRIAVGMVRVPSPSPSRPLLLRIFNAQGVEI